MSVELTGLVLIIILLLASNLFWALVCNRLVNKLMSRSYFEFEQAKALSKPSALPPQPTEYVDDEAERQAQDANKFFAI